MQHKKRTRRAIYALIELALFISLTFYDGVDAQGFSTSHNLIAFDTFSPSKICVVHADTKTTKCLTAPSVSASDSVPSWSPDGTKIAFVRRFFDGRAVDCSVFTVDFDGNNLTNISGNTLRCAESTPGSVQWSPDGSQISFPTNTRTPQGIVDGIVIAAADGSCQTPVLSRFKCGGAPWSPDGTTLATFCIQSVNNNSGIHLFNPDGTNFRVLIEIPDPTPITVTVQNIRWSPQGDALLFAKVRFDQTTGDTISKLFVIDTDGSNLKLLYTNPIPNSDIQGAEWSPSGNKVALSANPTATEEFDILTINPDGTNLTNISNDPAYALLPTWSPDGTRIAFFSGRALPNSIFTMNADGSSQTPLGIGGLDPQWSPRILDIPHITTLSPTSGPAGTLVTITGENFDDTENSSTVTFDSTVAAVVPGGWSDTQIEVTVPMLPIGPSNVVVTTSKGSSDPVVFKVRRFGIHAASRQIWANGHEEAELTVYVTDAKGRGVAGRLIRLSAEPPNVVVIRPIGGEVMTDGLGQARFTATSTAVGIMVFTATDVNTPGRTTSARVQFVQRRVAVFVQGIKTELNPAIEEMVFPDLRARLIELGFSRPPKGAPEEGIDCTNDIDDDDDDVPNDGCPLLLNYSYTDGVVSSATGIWLPNPYQCSDTKNAIFDSVLQLKRLILDFSQYNPNTIFIVIGHSQGGLIALQGARLARNNSTIDAVITLDGALGGAPPLAASTAGVFTCWGDPASSDMITIWNTTRDTDHHEQGTWAQFLGKTNYATVKILQSTGTKVVTIGSNDDCVWNPELCSPFPFPTIDNTSTQIIKNADAAVLLNLGGDCHLRACITRSHNKVYKNSIVLDRIQGFVGSPTVP